MTPYSPLSGQQADSSPYAQLTAGWSQVQDDTWMPAATVSGLTESSVPSMTMTSGAATWPAYPLLASHRELWGLSPIPSATGWTADQLRGVVIIAGHGQLAPSPYGSKNVFTNGFVGLSDFSTYLLADGSLFAARPESYGIDASQALSDLAEWTTLPTARLGPLLGVARRSIYNWIGGKPVRPEIQFRLSRVHEILRPIAQRAEPDTIRRWLEEGRPTNFELITGQQWSTVERRANALLEQQKVRRVDDTVVVNTDLSEPFSDAVRSAVLTQFRRTANREQAGRDDWVPRELTGAASFEDDDED